MSQDFEATRLVVGAIAGLRDHVGDGLGECYCSQCERDRAIVACHPELAGLLVRLIEEKK